MTAVPCSEHLCNGYSILAAEAASRGAQCAPAVAAVARSLGPSDLKMPFEVAEDAPFVFDEAKEEVPGA
jgi:hypothetical protein